MRRLIEGGTKHHYQVPLQCYSGHYEDLSVMENVFVGSERHLCVPCGVVKIIWEIMIWDLMRR